MKILEVCLLNRCNFHCDYCISGSNRASNYVFDVDTGEKRFVEIPKILPVGSDGFAIVETVSLTKPNEPYERILTDGHFTNHEAIDAGKLIPYIRENFPGFTIVISGGEPLIYPGIAKLIDEITKTNDIILLTNAADIRKFPSIVNNKRVFIRIGYHPEYRDMGDFFESMEFIKKRSKRYVVNYVLHPRHVEHGTSDKYIAFIESNNYNFEISPFKGMWHDRDYNYEAGIFQPESLSVRYTEPVPIDEILIPGQSFFTMYSNGEVWSCHRKRTMNGQVNSNAFLEYPSAYGLECIQDESCRCDSMRAYRAISNPKPA